MAYLKVLPQHSPRETEEGHKKSESRGVEQGTSRIQVWSAAATPACSVVSECI
jgi:hypothetical protein